MFQFCIREMEKGIGWKSEQSEILYPFYLLYCCILPLAISLIGD